jgi:Suppressor of fused protein (SUFU)
MADDDKEDERLWQEVYDARQRYFEATFGPFPKDILKMRNLMGVWPGGGLYMLPAARLGDGLWAYVTFGLSNRDMPTSVAVGKSETAADGSQRTTLYKRDPASAKPGSAGYGYEFMVVTAEKSNWPLSLVQWVCNAEILRDVGMLARVEKYDGLTVEKIDIGPEQSIDILIHKAVAPLPTGTELPNGRMDLLVATTITADEMAWSATHGRAALLSKLLDAGVGQISRPGRESVIA